MPTPESIVAFPPAPADSARLDAIAIVRRLQAAGFISYWAGGCVRDLLRGAAPRDYDIATNAIPDEVIRLFPDAHPTGKSFGVARVALNDRDFEIATFRADHGYSDGRHPDAVTFSDPVTDAERRDFTINAMFYDPVTTTLWDHVGGRADLEAGLIRAVGDPERRFLEDHLRMLRAVRFAARLEFKIEAITAAAIRKMAGRVAALSGERIRGELELLLTEPPKPGDAVALMEQIGLLEVILPEVAAMRRQAQPEAFHPEGDVLAHTILMLNAMERPTFRLAMAVLLHDVGKPVTACQAADRLRFNRHAEAGVEIARRIMARLRCANDDIDAVAAMVGAHMRFINVKEMRRSTLRALVGNPLFEDEMELHRLDCLASHGELANYDFLRRFQAELAAEPALPKPWINGGDVIALGIPEGRAVGDWLRRAYERQLEGQAAGRDELLAWLRTTLLAEQGDRGKPTG